MYRPPLQNSMRGESRLIVFLACAARPDLDPTALGLFISRSRKYESRLTERFDKTDASLANLLVGPESAKIRRVA